MATNNSERATKANATRRVREAEEIEKARHVGVLQALAKRRALRGSTKTALVKRGAADATLTSGLSNRRLIELSPNEFDKLETPDYQRNLQPSLINELIRALLAGGQVADPVTLSKRKWETDPKAKAKLYIVDGLQRAMAHIDTQRPLAAIVYDVDTYDHERQLFVTLNTTKTVSASAMVRAWSGVGAALLREMDATDGTPVWGRIQFGTGERGHRNLSASILIQGMAAACASTKQRRGGSETIQAWMRALDDSFDVERARAYVILVARIIGTEQTDRLPLLVARGIGMKLAEHWPHIPAPRSITRIQNINWDRVTMGSWAARVLPLVLNELEARWK